MIVFDKIYLRGKPEEHLLSQHNQTLAILAITEVRSYVGRESLKLGDNIQLLFINMAKENHYKPKQKKTDKKNRPIIGSPCGTKQFFNCQYYGSFLTDLMAGCPTTKGPEFLFNLTQSLIQVTNSELLQIQQNSCQAW